MLLVAQLALAFRNFRNFLYDQRLEPGQTLLVELRVDEKAAIDFSNAISGSNDNLTAASHLMHLIGSMWLRNFGKNRSLGEAVKFTQEREAKIWDEGFIACQSLDEKGEITISSNCHVCLVESNLLDDQQLVFIQGFIFCPALRN